MEFRPARDEELAAPRRALERQLGHRAGGNDAWYSAQACGHVFEEGGRTASRAVPGRRQRNAAAHLFAGRQAMVDADEGRETSYSERRADHEYARERDFSGHQHSSHPGATGRQPTAGANRVAQTGPRTQHRRHQPHQQRREYR